MTETLKQIAQEEIVKLPKEAQDAINAFDWGGISEEIGKKFSLLEDEINNFQVETLLVLLGVVDIDFYEINIEENVETSKKEAENLAKEAIQKIFVPLNDILMENIRKSGKSRNPNAEQTLNFILSSGDYSSFL